MSDNEMELLNIIRNSANPTTALITATEVCIKFLKEIAEWEEL